MIHYNVWFSFRDGIVEVDEMRRVRSFLTDLKSRGKIHDFQLLKNRAAPGKSKLARFHAVIMFLDGDQFGQPFSEVAAIGIHAGKHGFMIENVSEFVVETFEEL
jgi:hypothetical protein